MRRRNCRSVFRSHSTCLFSTAGLKSSTSGKPAGQGQVQGQCEGEGEGEGSG